MPDTYRFVQFLWTGLDWIFPPVCGGCDRTGYRWCPDCQRAVKPVPEPICDICGLPVRTAGMCSTCLQCRPSYYQLRSWSVFETPIRTAIHKLKYRRNLALGDALANQLQDFVKQRCWQVDLVVPVPLGRKRYRERGYNQVSLVARPLASFCQWRFQPRALCRARETQSQVGLSASERKANVADAFLAESKLVAGRAVLIVDDVATTGSTLNACAQACLDAGAETVYALTLARALPHHGLQYV